jgi:hypothetical protein
VEEEETKSARPYSCTINLRFVIKRNVAVYSSAGAKCDACDTLQDLKVVGVDFAELEVGGDF